MVQFVSYINPIYVWADVKCIIPGLSDFAGKTLGKLDRITTNIADSISNAVDPNREVEYLPNDGVIHNLYRRHRDRHRERLSRLCEFFRHGRLHRRPCRKGEKQRHREEDDYYREADRERDREKDKIVATQPPNSSNNWLLISVSFINQYFKIIVKKEETGKPCQTSDGLVGECESASYCFSQFNDIQDYIANRCQQPNGAQGVCCPKEVRKPSQTYCKTIVKKRFKNQK